MFWIPNQYKKKKLDKTNLSNKNYSFKYTALQLDSGFKFFPQWIKTEEKFFHITATESYNLWN